MILHMHVGVLAGAKQNSFCLLYWFFVTWQMGLLIINLQDGIWTSLNFSKPAGPAKRGERNPVYAFQRILMKMVTWQRLAEHGGTLLLSIYFLLCICIIPVWNLESCFGVALLYGVIQVVLVDITFLLLIHNVFLPLSLSLFVLSIRDFVMVLQKKVSVAKSSWVLSQGWATYAALVAGVPCSSS